MPSVTLPMPDLPKYLQSMAIFMKMTPSFKKI